MIGHDVIAILGRRALELGRSRSDAAHGGKRFGGLWRFALAIFQ